MPSKSSEPPQLVAPKGAHLALTHAITALNMQLKIQSPNPNGEVTAVGGAEVARLDDVVVVKMDVGKRVVDQLATLWRDQLGFLVVHTTSSLAVLGMRRRR